MNKANKTDLDLIHKKWSEYRERTHYDMCWLASDHAACAIKKLIDHIEAIEDENSSLRTLIVNQGGAE